MEIYDTKKEAIEAMNGRDIRLVKIDGGWALMGCSDIHLVKVDGGWALMDRSEYAVWLKQRGINNEERNQS